MDDEQYSWKDTQIFRTSMRLFWVGATLVSLAVAWVLCTS